VTFVDDIANDRDVMQAARRHVIETMIGHCDGRNGERVKQAIDRPDLWD
jgi:hypothetical protein